MRILNRGLVLCVFAASLLFGASSCFTEKDKIQKQGNEFFVTMDVSTLRSHVEDVNHPGTTPPNTDVADGEDNLRSLRWILFPSPSTDDTPAKFNHYFTPANLVANRYAFKMNAEDLGNYDMVFIANEPTGAGIGSPTITRRQLRNVKVALENVSTSEVGSGKSAHFLMTAEYAGVPLTRDLVGSGTEHDPYKIDLTQQNKQQRPAVTGPRSAVELMRALAKMEITLKDIVQVEESANGQKSYSWVLPYGFQPNSALDITFKNMPNAYYLIPRKMLTDIPSQAHLYQFKFSQALPDERYVVPLPPLEEPSIGGVRLTDYKIYVYLPEYIVPQGKQLVDQPGLQFEYKAQGVAAMKSQFFPISNSGATHYDYILNDVVHGNYSIYRNRLYRVKVHITGKGFL